MNPSEFPEVKPYPAIVEFLRGHVDMLFEDMRSMLKHPLHKSEGGNFAAANFICDLISGTSSVLYRPDEGIVKDRSEELLNKYFPWEEEEIGKQEGFNVISKWMRNPLTHRLRILTTREPIIRICKSPLNIHQIQELEDLSKRVEAKTLIKDEETYLINIPGLYRGIHKMLKKLFEDKAEMQRTKHALSIAFVFIFHQGKNQRSHA